MNKIERREIRSAPFNVRIRPSIRERIKEIAKENNVSQADVVENLVEEFDKK